MLITEYDFKHNHSIINVKIDQTWKTSQKTDNN